MEDAGASRDDIDLSLLQKQTANISVPGSDRFVQEGPIHFYSIDRMQTEEQLTNLLRQLQVTYNTLNEYTKSKSDMIAYVNLEYSKKFIYERIETAVAQLNRLRLINSDKNLLHSSIRGQMAESKASTMDALYMHSTMVGTGQIPRGHIQGLP